jgi:hypothetical protein
VRGRVGFCYSLVRAHRIHNLALIWLVSGCFDCSRYCFI